MPVMSSLHDAHEMNACGAHLLSAITHNSRTTRQIWIKFGMDVMPLGSTPNIFVNVLQLVLLTWHTNEMMKWDQLYCYLQGHTRMYS
jgi:hypothetical protein